MRTEAVANLLTGSAKMQESSPGATAGWRIIIDYFKPPKYKHKLPGKMHLLKKKYCNM